MTAAIELHVKDVAQLFHSLDPFPFQERDLDTDAEAYIVDSAKEATHGVQALIVHVDLASGIAECARDLEVGIHEHFARKVKLANRELRALLRRGWVSFLIGLSFLGVLLALSEVVVARATPSALALVLRESMLIGGWVALWRPLEIFLYDWWPIVGQRRTYTTLARIPVTVLARSASVDTDQIGIPRSRTGCFDQESPGLQSQARNTE